MRLSPAIAGGARPVGALGGVVAGMASHGRVMARPDAPGCRAARAWRAAIAALLTACASWPGAARAAPVITEFTVPTANSQSESITLGPDGNLWFVERSSRLAVVPIQTWNLKTQPGEIRHIGPVAQDFAAAFGFGEDDTHINTVDADGVAFAAIQGLYQLLQDKEARIDALEARLTTLEARER